jgi:hypothetical protein
MIFGLAGSAIKSEHNLPRDFIISTNMLIECEYCMNNNKEGSKSGTALSVGGLAPSVRVQSLNREFFRWLVQNIYIIMRVRRISLGEPARALISFMAPTLSRPGASTGTAPGNSLASRRDVSAEFILSRHLIAGEITRRRGEHVGVAAHRQQLFIQNSRAFCRGAGRRDQLAAAGQRH